MFKLVLEAAPVDVTAKLARGLAVNADVMLKSMKRERMVRINLFMVLVVVCSV